MCALIEEGKDANRETFDRLSTKLFLNFLEIYHLGFGRCFSGCSRFYEKLPLSEEKKGPRVAVTPSGLVEFYFTDFFIVE